MKNKNKLKMPFILVAFCIMAVSGCANHQLKNDATYSIVQRKPLIENFTFDYQHLTAIGSIGKTVMNYINKREENTTDETASINSLEIIAWAIKTKESAIPPQMHEELIVQVKWFDKSDVEHWTLVYLRSNLRSTDYDYYWRVALSVPANVRYKSQTSPPTHADIADFVQGGSFGYNEHDSSFNVVQVVQYRESEELMNTLKTRISQEERDKRSKEWQFYGKTISWR